MRTINVTGKANLKVAPSQTKVRLTIRGYAIEYGDALAKSVEDTKIIKDTISACGIDREALKTENFYTAERTKRVEDKNGNFSYRHIGYDVTHYMNFIFDNNNEILGQVLYELSKLSINPRLDVSYVVKDAEKYKSELIGLAVNDAKRKAEAMAIASGVTLGNIVHMDYSYQTISFESRRYLEMDLKECCKTVEGFNLDINPEDENLTDTVTITWEIN